MMLANTTSVTSLFRRACSAFDVIFKKGAFLHKFQNGKMFQSGWDEFLESREVIQGVIDEYTAAEQETYLDDVLVEEENMVGGDEALVDADGDNNII